MRVIKGPTEEVICDYCNAVIEIYLNDIQEDYDGMCKYPLYIYCPCCDEIVNCKDAHHYLVGKRA